MNITTFFLPFSILAFSGLRLVGLKVCYAGSDVAPWDQFFLGVVMTTLSSLYSPMASMSYPFYPLNRSLSLIFFLWHFLVALNIKPLPVLIPCLLLTTPLGWT
jgi:hypothetical protein